jgi:phosphatidate cytidylyltransferase
MNETLKRGISGAVYILILHSCILYSQESFIALFGAFLLIAIYEFCGMLRINKILPLLLGLVVFSLVSYTTLLSIAYNENIEIGILIASLAVSLKCLVFLFDDRRQKIPEASKYLYILGYLILPFIIITKLPYGINGYNPKIIIGIFILIWTNDTFAYLVGKSIGKNKLFFRISPKKTIEGFIGGVLFAILAGFFISKYFIQANTEFKEKSIVIWSTIAVITGIIGTIGDLVESKFKRVAGVKDSGKIMPGHGGVLDRLDSIIFAAPFIYLFYKILSYVS